MNKSRRAAFYKKAHFITFFEKGGVVMIIGCILSALGISGTILIGSYISNNRTYTFSPPFTDYETMVLVVFFACLIMAIVGILSIIFSIIKKRNEDTLNRLNNIGEKGVQLGVCPKCGINITQSTQICPKCGTKITNTKGND